MGKIDYGKWAVWMVVCVRLGLFAVVVTSEQPEFQSIACGGEKNYTGQNNIRWVSDANFMNVGKTAEIGADSQGAFGSHVHTLRFFPKPLNKSCYQLPVHPNVPFICRLLFAVGNYTGFPNNTSSFRYSLETQGTLIYGDVTVTKPKALFAENILVSSGSLLYICLIRTSDSDDPLINAIELRTLKDGMYGQAKPGMALSLSLRRDVGSNSWVRYPKDNFDRIWKQDDVRDVCQSTPQPISCSNTKNFPPTAVMQTACRRDSLVWGPGSMPAGWATLLLLYLAPISEPIYFYVLINGEERSDMITMVPNYSALELPFQSKATDATGEFKFELVNATDSNSPSIINAYEYFLLDHTSPATYSQDVRTLEDLKNAYDVKDWMDWISDPCYMIPWKGIGCHNISSSIRISEIDLSGMNLTGPVSEYIGQLTSLVNLSLGNNNLIGPLPDLSGLTMLERLHLQNNNLNGSLPDWLSNLNNLKELFIQNNNFSGVIPGQLLDKTSLNVKFTGNNYLCISYKAGECVRQIQETGSNSKRVKLRIILGITMSGGLIALAMGAIAVYRRKLRKRQRDNKDDTIKMPQLEKYPRFTAKDVAEATKHFSREIAQGDSGRVVQGTLDGRDVAVKKFKTFEQFQKEADVLSRAQHKNLMPLYGYCSELKNPMLIYEHMSGGSVWDKLHGAVAGDSILDWKTRLNIALNVAQGLEFMHAACTPKIIHRDVKTANILLDNNMNAKLADFGISRITKDGEASHATTSMAKGTRGYIDPEYQNTKKVTDKSDVYSFGVVLFEMICGRKAADARLPEDEIKEEINLVNWVTPYLKYEKACPKITDERLAGNYILDSIDRVAKLALRCIDDKPSLRPSMTDVVGEIKDAITLEKENNAQSEDMGWVDDSSEVRPLT